MGKITAHRAWTTIASALYNAPEGLNTAELGQWLGHKDIRSTQYCAKLHPGWQIDCKGKQEFAAHSSSGRPNRRGKG